MCTMTFPRSSNLQIHVRVKKGENRWYAPCVLSVLSRSLDQITCEKIARVHNGEKPNSCSPRSKSFVEAADLQIYLRVHTGGRPFSCFFCTKSFAQLSFLQEHLIAHSNEKPYSCSFFAESHFPQREM